MNNPILVLSFWLLFFAVSGFGQEARKIDDWGPLVCDHYLFRMDSAVSTIVDNSSEKLYFLVYEGKISKRDSKTDKFVYVYPEYGLAKARIRSMKKYLRSRKLPLENFVFIEAGFRDTADIEVWYVSLGVAPPKPTPTLKKMKYRKGKPKEFCIICC